MKNSVLATATFVALVASLVACKNETGGLPTPGDSSSTSDRPTLPGGGGTSEKPSASSAQSPGNSPVKDMDPCQLLSPADVASLTVGSGKLEEGVDESARTCAWNSSDQGKYTIRVNVLGSQGFKDIRATGQVKQLANIGKHQAVQYSYGTLCVIGLAITDGSRIETTVAAGNDTQRACQIATQVAQVVEPKLPGGS